MDYAQVTAAARQLAAKLRELFGSELDSFDFLPIPRGGLVIQGLLSYALDLPGDRLVRSAERDRPLVIVDDCAITGSRFREILRQCDRNRVIFAHLCSPPALREALLAREPAVSHAVAVHDLQDLAPDRMGPDYAAWRELAESRSGADRYWIGQVEGIVFPWNEPDHNFWNPVTGQLEWGWRVVPPELCIKNASTASSAVPIQVFEPARGEVMPMDHVISGTLDGDVYVLDSRNGGTLALEGVGALIWEQLLRGAKPEAISEGISRTWDLPLEQAAEDVEHFIDELVAREVLVLRTEFGTA
jgi:hypothetical protein